MGVVTHAAPWRDLAEFFGITPAQHHIVGVEGRGQVSHPVFDMLLPFFPAEPLETSLAHIVLVHALSIWLVAQLHGRYDAVGDQRGAEPGAQAQKEQYAALIAPQSLHGRIIDELDGTPEGSFEVKPDPTRAEVMRFGHHMTLEYQPRVANRYHIILPLPSEFLDSGNHLFGRQFWSGGKLPRLVLASSENLDG